jgi:hypothetical protein
MNPITTPRALFPRVVTVVAFIVSIVAPPVASAANDYWIGGSDWWNVGTNWNPAGQPQNGDYVYLTQSDSTNRTVYYANTLYPAAVLATLTIDATGTGAITLNQNQDSLASNTEYVSYQGVGTHTQSGGTNTVSGSLIVGFAYNGQGTYNLSGTGSLTANSEIFGYNGPSTGTFNQDGGTNVVDSSLILGQGGNGNYVLSGGSLTINSNAYNAEYIGDFGVGTFTQTGGSHTVNGAITLGDNSGSSGTYNLSGTGNLTAGSEVIGLYGTSSFTQSGGTNNVGTLNVALGSYNLTNGNLNAVNESLSRSGSSFTQSGGSNTVSGQLDITGYGPAATYNLNGGSLTVNTESVGGGSGGGVMAPGIFNQNGGTHTINQNLQIANNIWSSGTYNLNGGTLNVGGNIQYGGSGSTSSGFFNLDGGTLDVSGSLIGFDTFRIGNVAGSNGSFTLTSGKSLTANNEIIGNGGTGTLTQNDGYHLITNSLSLAANAGSSGTYNLNGGNLKAANITVNSGGTFNFNGGTLSVGQFTGDVANLGGTLAPGSSPGATNITGNYSQSPTGTFAVEIGGTGPGQFDVLNVSGTATLDGALSVSLFDLGSGLFTPHLGDSFDILTADLIQGGFSSLTLAALDPGLKWDISYLTDAIGTTDVVRLSVAAVPIPAAVWLFGTGLLGLLGVAKRRKQ